jgi:hypothetical protein
MEPVPQPTNAASNITTRCGKWYTVGIIPPLIINPLTSAKVKAGDTCGLISVRFGITLADFYFLNPFIDANCSNLLLDTAYCIQAVGTITTYPGYPTTPAGNITQPYTLPPETFTTETWVTVTPTVDTIPPPTARALAPGTWSNCSQYKDGVTPPDFVDQWDNIMDRSFYDSALYYCNNTAAVWGISMNDLLTWNPSLVAGNATGNCTLLPNFRYCTFVGDRKLPTTRPKRVSLTWFQHFPLFRRTACAIPFAAPISRPEPIQNALASE